MGKKVLILGGGFAGVECARQLESKLDIKFDSKPHNVDELFLLMKGVL